MRELSTVNGQEAYFSVGNDVLIASGDILCLLMMTSAFSNSYCSARSKTPFAKVSAMKTENTNQRIVEPLESCGLLILR